MISQTYDCRDYRASQSTDAASKFQRDLIALIPFLHKYSRKLCRNQDVAGDMAQEALAKAWRAREQFEVGTNLKAWLFTILRHEFYSYSRRAARETRWDAELDESIPGPAYPQECTMDFADTARALAALGKNQREALILVAVGGFSCEEAARLCGATAGTIKTRVGRGRARLLKFVDGGNTLPPRSAVRATDGVNNILVQLGALSRRKHTHNCPRF
jgi:RNA polymerase sigma-70 factor (ECF subfamily)